MTNPLLRPSAGEWLQGRYELLRVLDDGVFGTTWQARDSNTGRLVALKLVSDALVMNDGERRELAAKLEMFCGRSLAGCVMPIETVIIPGGIGVVSTLVDGVSLRSVMDARRARGQGLSPEECIRVLLSVVSALQALHTSSPHGGLRPENVLVTARGVLLTDCVLGVSFPPDRLHQRIVKFRPRAADYNAPELALGRRPTASADLFALGAMAAELAGGKALSEGPDLASISRELHRAVGTLLDRDPGRRPGGVRLLLDALTQAAGMERRPPEPPLPVPESVQAVNLLGDDDAPAPAPMSPPPPVADRAVARTLDEAADEDLDDDDDASQERTVVGPMPRPPGEDPDAATDHFRRTPPPAKDAIVPAPPPVVGGGRLSAATASLPLIRPDEAARSGPPPSMSVRSGPPPTIAPSAAALNAFAQRPVAPRLGRVEATRTTSFDDDGIDPKLLRAAQMLAEGRGGGPQGGRGGAT
ncbi:MAG: hypothetical protein U0325_08690 [Polyangiales bacterium]